MSVQTEINRISTAVSDQASLIAQIQTALEGKAAGGGDSGSDSGSKVKIGTITVSSNVSNGTIATVSNVGFQPTYVAIYAGEYKMQSGAPTSTWTYLMYAVNNSGAGRIGYVQKTAASSSTPPRLVYNVGVGSGITFTKTGFTWAANSGDVPANTYEYIAIG